jgi:hypothetical protein
MLRGVCEHCRENGSTEHCAAICHLWGGGSVKLGDSATTTHGKLYQVFGEYAVSRAQAFRWHSMVSEGRTLVEDEQVTTQHR